MSTYPGVRQVGTGGDLRTDVREWVTSDALRALVTAFGGDPDELFAGADLRECLTRLGAFTDRWDSRRGVERNLAAQLELTDEQVRLVGAASAALGLRDGRPPSRVDYDHVLLLGGLVRACVVRPAHAARLVESGQVRAGAVTALGGNRPFGGDEFGIARQAGLDGVSDEFAALDAGTRRAFDLGTPDREEGTPTRGGNADWVVRHYTAADGTPVRVAAAPSSDPASRRADTPDTYDWFARTVATLQPGDTILAVTTAIYVPAQHAAALRMLALPYGAHVETIGVEPGDVMPDLAQTFTPSHYLQEVRSAVLQLRDLLARL